MKIDNFKDDLFSVSEQNKKIMCLKIRLSEAEQIIKDIVAEKISKEVMVEVCKTYLEQHVWEY